MLISTYELHIEMMTLQWSLTRVNKLACTFWHLDVIMLPSGICLLIYGSDSVMEVDD